MRTQLFLFCLFFRAVSWAQSGAGSSTHSIQPTDLHSIPPSPEVANLGRYGNLPVSYYTGSLDLAIPLAEISDGPLHMPISLRYNSSGSRVEEVASWVGLGWTLEGGGVISRSVRGWADDAVSSGSSSVGFLDVSKQHSWADLFTGNTVKRASQFSNMAYGCWDTEPDLFNFNFNGYKGQFCFDWNGNLLVQCDKDIKIVPLFNAQKTIIGWRVVTENGTVYTFSDQETSTQMDRRVQECPKESNSFISAWYLSTITDVNSEHQLLFAYDKYIIEYAVRAAETRMSARGTYIGCPENTYAPGASPETETIIAPFLYGSLRLRSIKASHAQTQLLFTAGALRADTLGLTGSYENNLRSLAKVSVLDAGGSELKSQLFTYDPDYSTGRLTLVSVQQMGSQGKPLPAHRFFYSKIKLPGDVRSRSQDHWGFYNGATNKYLLPTYSVPTGLGSGNNIYVGGDRAVHPQYAQSGSLTKIIYPTGGYSTFTYESNDYSYVGGAYLGDRSEYSMVKMETGVTASPISDPPVLYTTCRTNTKTVVMGSSPIKVIWQGDKATSLVNPYVAIVASDGKEVFREYTASTTPQSGSILLKPDTYTLQAYACNLHPSASGLPYAQLDVQYSTAGALITKKLAGGLRLKEIRDYASLNDTAFTKKTFSYHWQGDSTRSSGAINNEPNYEYKGYYIFKSLPDTAYRDPDCFYTLHMARGASALGTTQGSFVGYREVTVKSEGALATGKTVYHYTSPYEYPDGGIAVDVPLTPNYSQSYLTGMLTERLDYLSTRTGYVPVRRLVNEYIDYPQHGKGVMALHTILCTINQIATSWTPIQQSGCNGSADRAAGDYVVSQYNTNLGHAQLQHTQQTDYEATTGNAHTKDLYYNYDQLGIQLLMERQPLSATETQVVSHNYLSNYSFLSPSMQQVLDLHAVPEIETITSLEQPGRTVISKSIYQDWVFRVGKLRLRAQRNLVTAYPIASTNYRFSATDAAARPDERLQETVIIDLYDAKGNVLQLHPAHGVPIARLWGHGQTRLVAEVQNAYYNQVAATSFEPGSLGQWVYDASKVQAGGQTGDWSYQLDSQTDITMATLIPAGDYELAVWASVEPQVYDGGTAVNFTSRFVGPVNAKGFKPCRYRFHLANATSGLRLTAASAVVDELRLYPVDAQVTTLTYNVALDETSRTDANGHTTTREYDALGRLICTRDERGHILSQQQYHYTGK